MGREIRRVPKNWQHPVDERDNYIPMLDEDYQNAAKEWADEYELWCKGEHPDQNKDYKYYWEYASNPPDEDHYRPKFESEPICYQIYENVSEGTPASPVFETLQEMEDWLVVKGYSRESARTFCGNGWALSGAFINGAMYRDIESCGK